MVGVSRQEKKNVDFNLPAAAEMEKSVCEQEIKL